MKNKIAKILIFVPLIILSILSTLGIILGMYSMFISSPLPATFICLVISIFVGLILKEE